MEARSVSEFRSYYREKKIEWWYSGVLHFLVIVGVSLGWITYAVLHLKDVTASEWLAPFGIFLFAVFFEYFFHRGPMHKRIRGLHYVFEKHAIDHHKFFHHNSMEGANFRDFKITLFPVEFVIFFGLGVMVPLGWVFGKLFHSDNVGYLVVASSFAYYLNYELFHLAYHAKKDSWIRRIPGMPFLMRLHQVHHDPRLMTRYNFNITYPICDWLFGTLHQQK